MNARPSAAPPPRRAGRALGIAAAALLAVTAVVLLTGQSGSPSGEPRTIVLYDPDANHQAIVNIASWFNGYLHSVDPELRFQPVQTRESFESVVREKKPGFAIVTASYLERMPARLDPLLVPARSGDPFYRKVLLATQQTGIDLTGVTVAASGGGADSSRSVVELLDAAGAKAKRSVIVIVSKDIDALLGLAFGQVQAALVTPESIAVLKQANPGAAAAMKNVLETPPILRAPLCAVGNYATRADRELVVSALTRMASDEGGRKAMTAMGFDSWKPYSPSMTTGR